MRVERAAAFDDGYAVFETGSDDDDHIFATPTMPQLRHPRSLRKAAAMQESLTAIASVLEARQGNSLSARIAASRNSRLARLRQQEMEVSRVRVPESAMDAGAAGPRSTTPGWAVGRSSAPAPRDSNTNRSDPRQEIVELVDSFKRQQRRVSFLVLGVVSMSLLLTLGALTAYLTLVSNV